MTSNTGTLVLVALLAVLSGAPGADAQAVRRERVTIPGPDTPVTVEGSVRGFDFVQYQVSGAAGETLALALSADNPQAYFNLYAPGDVPGEATALFIGARDGLEFRGTLTDTGDYTAHVVLMRPAARRAEAAEFQLTVEVSGEGSEAATSEGAPDQEQAAAEAGPAASSGARFSVNGQLPCAIVADAETVPCGYRALRRRGGTAIVYVTLANGNERALLFVGGHPVASDRIGAPFSAVRQGNRTFVSVDDERYEISPTVIRGY